MNTGPIPLTCEVLEFIEQYIIVEQSAWTHDPALTPQCLIPDSAHCTSVKCQWPSSPLHSQQAEMDLLPCLNPAGMRISVSNSQEGIVFNHTFQQSGIVKFNSDTKLNVTLTHPQEGVIGLEVSAFTNAC